MRTVDSNSRTAFLSAVATPEWQATIRRQRLDFGGAPLAYSTYNVIEASGYASDDRYGDFVWGDSCVTDSSDYYFRIINSRAWGGSNDYFASWTTDGTSASHWDYSDITNPTGGTSENVYQYCRIGVYPVTGSDDVYVWYADEAGLDLRRIRLDFTGAITWSGTTSACEIGGWSGCAIHPVSESGAFVVGYTAPYLWIRAVNWSGSAWDTEPVWIAWMTPDLAFHDAQFSDAVHLSGTEYVIIVNLARHGAVYSIKYDSATGIYSQPVLVTGGSAEWSGARVLPTGLSVYNSRAWLVVQKSMESSDLSPQAIHTAILSSADGIHWREEDFVGIHPCLGKLLYTPGESDIFVVGNAAVYHSTATQKFGTDVSSMKLVLDSEEGYNLTARSNTPHTLTVAMVDEDGTLLTDSLMETGNELTLETRESGEAYSELVTTYIEKFSGREDYQDNKLTLFCKGPMSRLIGKDSYRSPAGKLYESASSFYSNINFEDTGLARITVKQETGTWNTKFNPARGVHELIGKKGSALVPRSITTQWLTLCTHFRVGNSVDGVFVVFLYEDYDNYWRAGITRTEGSSTTRLVIQRIYNGALESDKQSTSFALSPDTTVYMYIDLRPGRVRVYANTSNENFSTGTTSLSYATTTDAGGYPIPFHVGFEVMDWIDYETANKNGTVTNASGRNTLTDISQTFDAGDIAQWVRVGTQWRKVVSVSTNSIWVSPDWAEKPALGAEYGLYDEKSDPYMAVESIGYCDGQIAWTVDDLVDDILETAGVGRTSVYTEAVNPLASANVMYDVDVKTTDATPDLYFFCSAQSSPSGWFVDTNASWITLQAIDSGTPTTVAVYPNLVDMSVIASTEIRYVFREGTMFVYAGGHYIGAFWNIKTSGSGYVGLPTGNTGTTTEFPRMQESFIWDEDTPASSAIANLLRGRPAKMVEKADGTIAISRYESHSDLGTWSATLKQTDTREQRGVSMVMAEGADTRQFYIDEVQSRRGVLFRKVRTEYAEGELPTYREAVKLARLAREESRPLEAEMHMPDIAAELEDQVEVESSDYVVEGYTILFGLDREKIRSSVKYLLRSLISAPTAGVWGTDDWGQFYWG